MGHAYFHRPNRTHALKVEKDMLGLGAKRADEMRSAMEAVDREGRGVVCLFRSPKNRLFVEEDEGPRTVKQIGIGAQILADLGVHDMVLLSNSRPDLVALEGYGITITDFQNIPE